ncbi:MAG: hypothetical protein E7616_01715 [Ruminococcaceae bacterium]|nr:hypothetical protein [Oscillospiraceae bacterium]
MKIEHITIRNFGKLSDFELSLESGLNIIEGANESGKSTIAAFIRFIFYGLSGRSDGEISPREQYLSWSKGEASGSLEVSVDQGRYRIERTLTQNSRNISEHLAVVDIASGTILKNANPAALFLAGVPEDVFCRTAFVGQEDGSILNGKQAGQAIENILSSADESINTKKAIKKLDEARVMLLHKNKKGGKIYELENMRDDLRSRAVKAEEDCRLLEEKKRFLKENSARLHENEEHLKEAEAELAFTEARRRLEQIEKSKKAETELSLANEELDDLVSSLSANNFFPTETYLLSLENTGKKLLQITDEKKKLAGRIEETRQALAEPPVDTQNNDYIGILSAHESKCNKLRLISIALLIPAPIIAIIGAVKTNLLLAIPLPALLLIGSGILFWLSLKEKAAYTAILQKLGIENKDSIADIISQTAMQQARYQTLKETYADLESEMAAVIAAEAALSKEAAELAARWGKKITGIKDLAKLIAESKDACLRMQKAVVKKDTCQTTYNALRTPCTEEELAELSEILKRGGRELTSEEYSKVKRSQTFYRQTIEMLSKKVKEAEHLIIQLRAHSEVPKDLRDRADQLDARIEALNFRHDAYLLAGHKLNEATALLRAQITPMLSGEASAFMAHATEGKYQTVGVSDSFSLSYSDGKATRTTEYLSCGTQDLAYLGLRLGLAKVLFPKSLPPLIFDESFSRLDDRRMAMAFTYLSKIAEDGGQVILLTSNRRERKYAEAIGNCHLYQL